MASDALGLLAALFVVLSECFACTRLRLASALLVVALSLLLAAFRRSYLIIATMLTLFAGAAAALYRLPPECREVRGFRGIFFGGVAPNVLAGFFHLVGVWVLPFCAVWGWSDAYSDDQFFVQDIGHLVPATFYFLALVLLPLLMLPPGYEKGGIDHQLYEGAFNFVFAIVYFVIFRVSHWYLGENPPKMSAPNWDHEFLGLVWAASGAIGVLTARAGYRTSAHITFPAAFISYSMLTHSNAGHADMSTMEPWKMTWMKLHKIHGICFGVGALCRLLYRIPEAVFFFFLGSFAFVFSAIWISKTLFDALNYTEDVESGYDPNCPDCEVHYPVDHVTALLVVTVGAVSFPVHLAALGQLRKFVEQLMKTAFTALPTTEESFGETTEELNELNNGTGEMASLKLEGTKGVGIPS